VTEAGPSGRVASTARDAPLPRPPGSGLEETLRALRDPDAYPERPTRIETRETHVSWVFLTETSAYKLKKPVRYAFLDYRTLERRRWACREELRLNRRLAPRVYLDVLPLAREGGGLRVGGRGTPVEWLVWMRRLGDDRMLDRKIREGTLRPFEPRAAAALLARFYRRAAPVPMSVGAYRRGVARELAASRHELVDPRSGLDEAQVDAAVDAATDLLARAPGLLDERVLKGRIVEGHGDLRPEHVALGPVAAVIDCLEFDRELRLLDPADELAFLRLECERLGCPAAGELFLSEYRRLGGDDPPAILLDLYAVTRALVRAKLAVWRLREPGADIVRWRATAMEYVALACERARLLSPSAAGGGGRSRHRGRRPDVASPHRRGGDTAPRGTQRP
jgi:aminoglycoside phosphotransferase family enzyme